MLAPEQRDGPHVLAPGDGMCSPPPEPTPSVKTLHSLHAPSSGSRARPLPWSEKECQCSNRHAVAHLTTQ